MEPRVSNGRRANSRTEQPLKGRREWKRETEASVAVVLAFSGIFTHIEATNKVC